LAPSLGVPGIVLLPVAPSDARVGEHHDAGLRAVDSSLPRSLLGERLAVVVLGRVLADAPDVALASCAYHSDVSSTSVPPSVTVSRTTTRCVPSR
jgi:hypothetical protein